MTEEDDIPVRDARQFSRHLVANLTAVLGLPDTQLETDLVFQNSFLPRSVAFNLSSSLLKRFGGSAQVRLFIDAMVAASERKKIIL